MGFMAVNPIFQNEFFKDKHGKAVVWQTPNLPLSVGLTAMVLTRLLPFGQLNYLAALIAFGAIFTWAWQETFAGASQFRQLLGAVVLVWLVLSRIY